MITPQPNKHINIILPYTYMKQGTEIIVQDEAWYLVDCDLASVPGIIFMSFTETNINQQRDDVGQSIANIDKLAEWTIQAPSEIEVEPHSEIALEYYVSKNGILQENTTCDYNVSGNLIAEDGKIYAGEQGEGIITLSYLDATFEQKVTIGGKMPLEPILIGDDKIRLTGRARYILQNVDGDVEFSISNENLAALSVEGNSCTITANAENKIGNITLTASYNGQSYTKNIEIVSLWQVI